MPSLQRVILLGHCGSAPETKDTRDGGTMARVSLCVNGWDPEKKEEVPTWYSVTCFGKQASYLAEYGKKGSALFVDGDLQVVATDKDVEARYWLNVRASRVVLVGGKGESTSPPTRKEQPAKEAAFIDEDLPF